MLCEKDGVCMKPCGEDDILCAEHRAEIQAKKNDVPTWHVVIDTESKILGTYPGENLSAAQEFARRTSAQAGEPVARVEQVRDWTRPRVGDIFKTK